MWPSLDEQLFLYGAANVQCLQIFPSARQAVAAHKPLDILPTRSATWTPQYLFGNTQNPELEQKIRDDVGSYRRQLGHIGDALEVIVRHLDRNKFTKEEKDATAVLEVDLARIRQIKKKALGPSKQKAGIEPKATTKPL
jgi:hypothetical protein